MRLNPVAAVLVALAVLGIIIAVRGTQDNLASALTGRQVGTAGGETAAQKAAAAAAAKAAQLANVTGDGAADPGNRTTVTTDPRTGRTTTHFSPGAGGAGVR